jgi:hypothetical protein
MKRQLAGKVAALAVTAAALLLPSAGAQEEKQPGGESPPSAPDPKAIWPAGLEQLAGRYAFVQVASPGGLWERAPNAEGGLDTRQVSINEVPPALREKLTHAEIVISDLKLPTTVEASERVSPSKRGKLRFYSEAAEGRLALRNVPGIGGDGDDRGDFTGPVLFALEHQGHTNPSVSGILLQRLQQEVTWGAATLDFADLSATPLTPEDKPDAEAQGVIANARALRSGTEIFAYVHWSQKLRKGERVYSGSIRLMRREAIPAGPPPGVVAPPRGTVADK